MEYNLKELLAQLRPDRKKIYNYKYGGEVVRMNQNARKKLHQMVNVTKLSKRSLVSYAISLLSDEFDKWAAGDPDSKFGYDMESFNGEQE